MALRLLLYNARLYEKLTDTDNLYSTRQIALPRPEFYVLYNGIADYPDKSTMKLSDAFSDKANAPALELIVPVYNINEGHNKDMLAKSATLNGYSTFIDKAREFEAEIHDRSAAIKKALDYCIRNGILVTYFKKNSSEVNNMLLTEWNTDDAIRVRSQEAREDGRNEGIRIGEERGEQRAAAQYQAQIAELQRQLAQVQRKTADK
jgi:hypothetical protein